MAPKQANVARLRIQERWLTKYTRSTHEFHTRLAHGFFKPRKDARRTKPEIVHSLTTYVTLKENRLLN